MEVMHNGYLSERKPIEVVNNCFIGRKSFQEAEFVLNHCQLLEADRRSVRCDTSIQIQ